MAASLGNTKKAYIKISSTYTWLSCEQSNSINITQEAVETSDKSTAWAQFITGKKDIDADWDAYLAEMDASGLGLMFNEAKDYFESTQK